MKILYNKNVFRCIVTLLLVAIFVIEVCPYAISIYCSVPSADDFSSVIHPYTVINAIDKANEFYITWAGRWIYVFMLFVFNPLSYSVAYGNAVGVFLVIMFFIFIIAVYTFVAVTFKILFGIKNNYVICVAFLLLLYSIMNEEIYYEIFYWFVGNYYLWMEIFALFACASIAAFLKYSTNSALQLVMTSVLGFIACFDEMNCIALGLIYIFMLIKLSKRRGIIKYKFIPLFFMILGGMISVFAPGNYVRHAAIDSDGLKPVEMLGIAIQNSFIRYGHLIKTPVFLMVIISFFLIGYFTNDLNSNKNRLADVITIWIGGWLATMGVLYPIALGYSNEYLPNRMRFCVHFVITVWSACAALYTGIYIANRKENIPMFAKSKIGKMVIFVVPLVVVIFSLTDNSPIITVLKQMDEIKAESIYYKSMLKQIDNSNSENVIITIDDNDIPRETGIIKPLELSDDKNNWINQALASYFGKKSVSIQIKKI